MHALIQKQIFNDTGAAWMWDGDLIIAGYFPYMRRCVRTDDKLPQLMSHTVLVTIEHREQQDLEPLTGYILFTDRHIYARLPNWRTTRYAVALADENNQTLRFSPDRKGGYNSTGFFEVYRIAGGRKGSPKTVNIIDIQVDPEPAELRNVGLELEADKLFDYFPTTSVEMDMRRILSTPMPDASEKEIWKLAHELFNTIENNGYALSKGD